MNTTLLARRAELTGLASSVSASLILSLAVLLLAFSDTAASILRIWLDSETFAHGVFVFPVFLWLVWRKREAITQILSGGDHAPDYLPLPLLLASGASWLLSRAAGIQVGEQLSLVFMAILLIWSLIGRRLATEIRFPLMFLVFMAPVGEELVPALMHVTAELVATSVSMTGIPIYREGLFFSLPTGDWSVVEACSGIRYLIASIVLGTLYAYLSYRSVRRQIAFVVLAAVVPIFANGLRAFLIVMIGHFSSMQLATGVDHLIYGWLFFGIVMFALFTLGALFREKEQEAETRAPSEEQRHVPSDSSTSTSPTVSGSWSLNGASRRQHAALLSVSLLIWPLWISAIEHQSVATGDAGEALRTQLTAISTRHVTDINPQNTQITSWRPVFNGYEASFEASIEADPTTNVLALAFLYGDQGQGREMISSSNVLTRSKSTPWRHRSRTHRNVSVPEWPATVAIEETRLNSDRQSLLVWRWYTVGDTVTASAAQVKFRELANRLLLRPAPGTVYVLAVDADTTDAQSALLAALRKTIAAQSE